MTTTFRLQQIQRQIAKIKGELLALGDLHPGSLSRQYNVCGKPGCRCKDPKNPRRHGPYHKVSYVYRGRSTSRFVSRDQVKEIQAELANYKRFRKLTDEWVGLALKLAKEKRKLAA
jgi:hypothetical protein